MKTFFFFLLSALLTGCSTNYNYPSKNITVIKTSGIEKEYGLLSVRGDSAIVVLDWSESKIHPLPFSHAEVIKNNVISRILRDGKGGGPAGLGIVVGALGSGLLFSGGGILIYGSHSDAFGVLFMLAGAIVGGGIAGGIIGNALPPSKELLLISAQDRDFLRSISAYPDKEPEEMRYIK